MQRDFFHLRGRDVTFDLVMRNGKQNATNLSLAPTYSDNCVPSWRIMGTVKKFDEKLRYGLFSATFITGDIVFFAKDMPPHLVAALGTTTLIGKSAVFSVIREKGRLRAQKIIFCGDSCTGVGKGTGNVEENHIVDAASPLHNDQGAQGTVILFHWRGGDGYGFISCVQSPGVDLYFKSTTDIAIGTELAFNVKVMPDGRRQARNLKPALVEDQNAEGTVLNYDLQRGFGFIRIASQPNDVFFHWKFVPEELQKQQLDGMRVAITITLKLGNTPRASSVQFLDPLPSGVLKL